MRRYCSWVIFDPDLVGVHLTGVHLMGMYLMGVQFKGVYFTGVHLIARAVRGLVLRG
jgi:hypothetical protein